EGRPSPLPTLPVQYADFSLWQRRWLSGEVLERDLAYFRESLAGLAPLSLSTDRPRPAVGSGKGGVRRFAFPAELAAALLRVSRAPGAPLSMPPLAGFGALLSRYSGQEDLAVGSPIAGRTHRELERLIGFFVNTLVLRLGLAGRPGLHTLVGRAREVTLGA